MRKKPMLAYPVSDKPIDYNEPVFIQPKLDGVRCVIQYDAGEVTAYSRTGKEWKNIEHIKLNLYRFFDKFPNVILDGELYNHDLKNDFEKIISLVRKQKPTDKDRSEARTKIQYHVYDYIVGNTKYLRYKKRMDALVCSNIYTPSVCYVESKRIATPAIIKIAHQANLDRGYEGSIIRLNGVYEHKRSKNLLKVKDFSDSEAKIVDFVEGKGKRRGTIGKFIAIDAGGVKFGMPVMDKFKYLQDNFKTMQGWIGRTATFTYFERTKAGSYRHPLFKAIRNYE